MSITPVHVPQLGESIREARIVTLLRKAGDRVLRDEPLVEVETDKALYVIESPAEGLVGEWSCSEGALLTVGTLLVEITGGAMSAPRNSGIAPRLRERARRLGISAERLQQFVAELGRPVTEVDLDVFARGKKNPPVGEGTSAWPHAEQPHTERPHEEQSSPVPATIGMSFCRRSLESFRKLSRQQRSAVIPSSLEWFAWHTLRAMNDHPRVRALIDERHTLRPQSSGRIGIALELPNDGLGFAVMESREEMDITTFVRAFRDAVDLVKTGRTGGLAPQVMISSLAHLGVKSAIPVVSPPSVATIFIGAPSSRAGGSGMERHTEIAMTFDHRAFHGATAARFLRDVVRRSESISSGR